MNYDLAYVFAEALAEERAKLEAKVQVYRQIAIKNCQRSLFAASYLSKEEIIDAEAEKILKESGNTFK